VGCALSNGAVTLHDVLIDEVSDPQRQGRLFASLFMFLS
jgi:hypothetical protein